METKKTLVLGASKKPDRYANKAVRKLQNNNIPIYAVGYKTGEINGTDIHTDFPIEADIHTVTLYLSKKNQEQYYDKIIQLNPKRVIFNPGTENPTFEKQLNENGIATEIACTLVMLSTNIF